MQSLVSSAARTTSSASTGVDVGGVASALFFLTVTAAATDAGDTLDVYVQHSPDGGTTWDDFVHFTQAIGTGGAKKYLATWRRDGVSPESEMHAPQDGALTAGAVVQGPVATLWRVKWVIVNTSTVDVSFTFAVSMSAVLARR